MPVRRSLLPVLVFLLVSLAILSCTTSVQDTTPSWPDVSRETKPWTYWWWPGSAVTKADITANLEDLAAAGMGGVHIIPIYGVKGCEDSFIPYLSDEWMQMLAHCTSEAARLGMGVDMTSGTGWPFGGPYVDAGDAASKVRIESLPVPGGRRIVREFDDILPQSAVLYLENGKAVILDSFIDREKRSFSWDAPKGAQTLYFLFQEGTGQQVKRAAPGGEGNVLDYYSSESLSHYLGRFDEAFAAIDPVQVRAFYNDSFEVYNSNWTDNLLVEFKTRRGYDLREHLPALAGKSSAEENARVAHDYNETVSDLLLERFTIPWVKWSNGRGSLTRSQSHGSPGNLLDLYAAADIPETEAFGPSGFPIPGLRVDKNIPEHFGKPDYYVQKFASSAAHVSGKNLVSSESCTWLGEHFQVSLSQVKPEIDALFLSGINHVFFHGMAYSPKDATWPGWLFYASTNFAQTGSFWRDIPELNRYIARCQSFLQAGEPDNDILLYWPVHDRWMKEADADMLHHFQVHNAAEWLHGSQFHECARQMKDSGYSFDYISDSQIGGLTVSDSNIVSSGTEYDTIIIPKCSYIPSETMLALVNLAENGATVIYMESMPEDVPGWTDLAGKRDILALLKNEILEKARDEQGISVAPMGDGTILSGSDITAILGRAGCVREDLIANGVAFIRRKNEDGYTYFVSNNGPDIFSRTVSLARPAENAVFFDAVSGAFAQAETKLKKEGLLSLYLELEPGESRIIRTYDHGITPVGLWHDYSEGTEALTVDSGWTVTFIDGAPELPESREIDRLVSWTAFGEKAESFHGTARYKTTFTLNDISADEWRLVLGTVCESAKVYINGEYAGALWCFPFAMNVKDYLAGGENLIEIEVTNLATNRIRDLDRRGVDWKKFYDINYVSIRYEAFDASLWDPVDSGLLGPVRLIPLNEKKR